MLRSELVNADNRECWKVSSGTAAVLGLANTRLDSAPTTAYLMLGERCLGDCAFCAQGRSSHANPNALSRVLWPEFGADEVAQKVATAYAKGYIQRLCFQVTVTPGYLAETEQAVRAIAATSDIPICASVAARRMSDIKLLLDAGADRVTLALDAACERIYAQCKTGSFQRTRDLLREASAAYPGHIGTHVIVGLGETEQEMLSAIHELYTWGVSIGLFAFTPIRGTALANQPPPTLDHYRRIQAGYWLIHHAQELAPPETWDYDRGGRLRLFALPQETLRRLLSDGSAFRTSGCPGCNRPYYNERPGGLMYNYPRPLTADEARAELDALIDSLAE